LWPEEATETDYGIPARVLASLLGENCLVLCYQPRSRFALLCDQERDTDSIRGTAER